MRLNLLDGRRILEAACDAEVVRLALLVPLKHAQSDDRDLEPEAQGECQHLSRIRVLAKAGLSLHIAAHGEDAGLFRAKSAVWSALKGIPTRLTLGKTNIVSVHRHAPTEQNPRGKTILDYPDGTQHGLIGRRESTSEVPGRNPAETDRKSPRSGSGPGMRDARGECKIEFGRSQALLA